MGNEWEKEKEISKSIDEIIFYLNFTWKIISSSLQAPLPSFPLWTTHTGPFKGPYSFRLVILVTSFLVDKPKAKIRTTDKEPSKDLRG